MPSTLSPDKSIVPTCGWGCEAPKTHEQADFEVLVTKPSSKWQQKLRLHIQHSWWMTIGHGKCHWFTGTWNIPANVSGLQQDRKQMDWHMEMGTLRSSDVFHQSWWRCFKHGQQGLHTEFGDMQVCVQSTEVEVRAEPTGVLRSQKTTHSPDPVPEEGRNIFPQCLLFELQSG